MNHPPSAIGLLLCELVIVEHRTNNVTPVNCFSFREVSSFPSPLSFFALAWLADGRGDMTTEIAVDRLETQEEVFRLSQTLTFSGPLHDLRFVARIHNCAISAPGYYDVSLWIERELIAHRKFRVMQRGGGE